jgi:predicted dienelactone hydrolase
MRTLEVALWLVSTAWASGWLVPRIPRRVHVAAVGSAIVFGALHVTIEGVRVHMIPIYGVLAALSLVELWQGRFGHIQRPVRAWTRVAVALPVAVVIVLGWVLPTTFPVFAYDEPRGRYGIGTAVYELKDGPRRRDLVVQAWYPTERGGTGARAGITTHPRLLAAAYGSFAGLPTAAFDNVRLVRTHAIVNASVAREQPRYPVILFSHGPLGANRSQSVFQMEALASAGFVTIAVDHTGYASTTIFPNGHAVPPGPDAAWPVFVDERSTAMLTTWVRDVQFVLDRLEVLDQRDPNGILTGRLDLARVGYVGASFGGSVVVQALLDEPRIKAGVAEDGKPYFAERTLTQLRRPLMYMQSGAPYIPTTDAQLARWGLTAVKFRMAEQDHYARQMQLFGHARDAIYNVYIRRTNHVTFSDLDLIIRLPDSQLMDIRRAHRIINDYTIAFFERYLNGAPVSLVDGRTPSPYQEVTVASRNAGAPDHLSQQDR